MGLLKFIQTVPLFAVLLIAYNVVVGVIGLGSNFANNDTQILDLQVATIMLPSQRAWIPTYRDLLIVIGLFVLYIEIFKSTKTDTGQILEHTFSLFIFIVYLIEFLMVPLVADSAFLILACMSLIDVVAGFTITISAARRDLSVG